MAILNTYADGYTLAADGYLTITSAGSIGGVGLIADPGSTVVNSGAITAAAGATGANSTTGDPGDGGAGDKGATLEGSNLFTNKAGATITGGVGGVGGDSTAGYGGGGGRGGYGVTLQGAVSLTNNAGATITGGAGGAGGAGGDTSQVGAGGLGGFGLTMSGGSVANAGTIVGGVGGSNAQGGGGIYIRGGYVANTGVILGAVAVDPQATGGDGVDMSAGTLSNFGTIVGGAYGADTTNNGCTGLGIYGGSCSCSNNGTIVGGAGESRYGDGGFGVTDDGESFSNNGTIVGGAGGNSSGKFPGAYGGTGVQVNGFSTFSNNGAITGGAGGNASGVGDDDGGVGLQVVAGSIANNGTISGGAGGRDSGGDGGDGGVAVTVASGASFVNLGTVAGGLAGASGAAGVGIRAGAGYGYAFPNGQITNGAVDAGAATISGLNGVQATYAKDSFTVTNFATITGANDSVLFVSASDRLIAEAGSVFNGKAVGGGGTFELAAGVGMISGLGGAGTLTGAVSADFGGFGAYVIDAGGRWTITNAGTLASSQSLTLAHEAIVKLGTTATLANAGAVDLAGGTLGGGSLVNSGTITGFGALGGALTSTGAIIVQGGALTLRSRLNLESGATFTNTTAVTQTGIVTLAGGQITNDAGATWSLANDVLLATGDAGSFTNAGTLAKTNSAPFDRVSVDFTSAGTVSVATGTLDFTGAVSSFAGTVNGGGTLDLGWRTGASTTTLAEGVSFSVAELEIEGAGTTVTLAGALNYAGELDDTNATLDLAGNSLTLTGPVSFGSTIGTAPAVVTGTGTLTNSFAASLVGRVTLGGGMTFDNLGTLTDSGLLTLADATVDNGKGAALDIVGNETIAVTAGDTGSIANSGTLELTGATGQSDIAVEVRSSGLISVASGTLEFSGAVLDQGKVDISGGVADFDSLFNQNVDFTGASGELELHKAQNYHGTITGFSTIGANSLDLADITFISGDTTATFSGTSTGGVLTVSDGLHSASISLAGDYLGSTFTVSADASGKTVVTDPGASPSVHALTAAIASFAPGAASMSGVVAHGKARLTPMLAAATPA